MSKFNEKNQLVAKIKQVIAKGYGGVKSHFAKNIGISDAHLINIITKSKWDKVSDKTWYSLAQLFYFGDSHFYQTINVRKIREAHDKAIKDKALIGISAYTGAGKTTTFLEIKNNHTGTHYVLCDSLMTKADLINEIADKLPINPADGKKRNVQKAIVKYLIDTDNACLIIDSASKLSVSTLQWIGDLAELIEHKAGLIIAGTEYLRETIIKCDNRNKQGYKEFNRRIAEWKALKAFSSNEVQGELKSILKQEGITKQSQVANCLKQRNYGSFFNTIKSAQQENKQSAILELKNV